MCDLRFVCIKFIEVSSFSPVINQLFSGVSIKWPMITTHCCNLYHKYKIFMQAKNIAYSIEDVGPHRKGI